MNKEQITSAKLLANELSAILERHKNSGCSYDRALEVMAVKMIEWHERQPIVGYVKSGSIRRVLYEIVNTKKVNTEKTYMFDCRIHQNEMVDAENILKQL